MAEDLSSVCGFLKSDSQTTLVLPYKIETRITCTEQRELMIEQDVIHAKQIKALSFPLAAFKFTNMGRVIRQACLYTAFKPAN